jgi:hypothetical protein
VFSAKIYFVLVAVIQTFTDGKNGQTIVRRVE